MSHVYRNGTKILNRKKIVVQLAKNATSFLQFYRLGTNAQYPDIERTDFPEQNMNFIQSNEIAFHPRIAQIAKRNFLYQLKIYFL